MLVEEEVASTQDLARAGFRGTPLLVVAQRQTAGRGRGGSRWETAPRAMAASLAFSPGWPQPAWSRIPLVAGLAACDALGERVRLKWPNDVLVGEDKVGGLLAEAAGEVVVMGFGLNLWWPSPPPGVGAVHLQDPGVEAVEQTARSWAEAFLHRMGSHPEEWGREEYLARCVTLGRQVTWQPQGEGRAVDVDHDGALVVETAAGRVTVRAGEVRHVRTVDRGAGS